MERHEIAEVLEKAADLYESETIEWCKGSNFLTGPGKLSACAQGAINLAAGTYRIAHAELYYGGHPSGEAGWIARPGPIDPDEWERCIERSNEVIRALGQDLRRQGQSYGSVPNFNDRDVRTKQEVIDAMKECAKELRNEA